MDSSDDDFEWCESDQDKIELDLVAKIDESVDIPKKFVSHANDDRYGERDDYLPSDIVYPKKVDS